MDKKPMSFLSVIGELIVPLFPNIGLFLTSFIESACRVIDQYVDSRIDAKLNERDKPND